MDLLWHHYSNMYLYCYNLKAYAYYYEGANNSSLFFHPNTNLLY
jgi:hypothetical protein